MIFRAHAGSWINENKTDWDRRRCPGNRHVGLTRMFSVTEVCSNFGAAEKTTDTHTHTHAQASVTHTHTKAKEEGPAAGQK